MDIQSYFSIIEPLLFRLQSGDIAAIGAVSLSMILLFLLVMLLFLGRGGKKKSAASLMETIEPAIASSAQPPSSPHAQPTPPHAQQPPAPDHPHPDNTDNAADAPPTGEFKIFKREPTPPPPSSQPPNPASPPSSTNPAAVNPTHPLGAVSIEDNLRLIERDMLSLRDAFQKGDIDREVYIDETRNLYQQAKAIETLPPQEARQTLPPQEARQTLAPQGTPQGAPQNQTGTSNQTDISKK